MSNKEKAIDAKNRGNAAFQKGDYPTSVRLYTEAIQFDPNDHTFYTNRSAAFSSLNQHEKALEDATKAVELKSDWMKGHYRRGVSLLQLGRHGEAVRALEIAVRLAPSDQEVRKRLEEAQSEQRRVEKERRLAGEHLPSKGFGAEKEEGNRLYKEGKYDQAVGAYTRALQAATTDDERVVVLSNRAAALSQQKYFDRVIQDVNEVMRLDPQLRLPSTVKALIRRGLAYEDSEKWELAAEDMRRVVVLDPNARQASEALIRLNRNLQKKKEWAAREKK
jgi:tetratricopeptide (TPR) repeat protein